MRKYSETNRIKMISYSGTIENFSRMRTVDRDLKLMCRFVTFSGTLKNKRKCAGRVIDV